jgi:hypothetical protein
MTHDSTNSFGETGDWLMAKARRNPEALLFLAAGCALLMRGGGSSGRAERRAYGAFSDEERGGDRDSESVGQRRGRVRGLQEKVSGAAEAAGEYASGVTERVYETASSYASAASQYADAGRRRLTRQAYRASRQAGHMLHEQPLAVASLGLAAGAAIAALLPRMEMEERALRPAREALADAASRATDSAKEAASEAGRRLQQKATDIGTTALKEAAREAVQNFTSSGSSTGSAGRQQTGGSGT